MDTTRYIVSKESNFGVLFFSYVNGWHSNRKIADALNYECARAVRSSYPLDVISINKEETNHA